MNIATNIPDRADVIAIKDRVITAIKTLRSLPDKEAALLWGSGNYWPEIVQSSEEAYGYNEAKAPRFQPTAKDIDDMLPALGLLLEHKSREASGERDYKIIWARAFGVPWWKLAQRHGRAEYTLQRWFDGAMASIYTISCENKKRTRQDV